MNPASVKINALEVENVKRIKAIRLDCAGNALTVIGGNNGAGKTSVLDAIAYALGGEKFRPGNIERDGAEAPPAIRLTLSNGLIVERNGKNSALKVTDPKGMKGGQKLLDEFVSVFALDLPRFLNATAKEKAAVMLRTIGVEDELAECERAESAVFAERTAANRAAEAAEITANNMPRHPEAPDSPVSVADLLRQQQQAEAANRDNRTHREHLARIVQEGEMATARVAEAEQALADAAARLASVREDYAAQKAKVATLADTDTAQIVAQIESAEDTNAKVRANSEHAKAKADAEEKRKAHARLDAQLAEVRRKKSGLLDNADLPLPELTVQNGELVYRGQPWDGMSGAEQLRVATAVVRKLNPSCGFVLLDKLEQMDMDSLREFAAWLESEGLQAIATRVSTGPECSLVIEDGAIR